MNLQITLTRTGQNTFIDRNNNNNIDLIDILLKNLPYRIFIKLSFTESFVLSLLYWHQFLVITYKNKKRSYLLQGSYRL
jgi:hypothetical protein